MVWRQHKRDFIFFEQRRHIERHYGRTPSAVGAPALGAQDSIRFGDWRGCLGGQQRAPKSGYPDGYEIKVTCDSLSSRMLPYHQYPIPQREPLLRIIRNRGIHSRMSDAAITSAVLRLPQRLQRGSGA